MLLNLGVPSLVLLEDTKGDNSSQGFIVNIVTQDSIFSGSIPSSVFLPELKDFLISNSWIIVSSLIILGFFSFKYFSENSGSNECYNNRPSEFPMIAWIHFLLMRLKTQTLFNLIQIYLQECQLI